MSISRGLENHSPGLHRLHEKIVDAMRETFREPPDDRPSYVEIVGLLDWHRREVHRLWDEEERRVAGWRET